MSVPACLSARGQHEYSSAEVRLASYSDLLAYLLISVETCNECTALA